MLDDVKDSIKAKLYDFQYTPFMSSFIIAWVIINHRYLLIYFGDEEITDKIKLLDAHVFQKIPYHGYDLWVDQFWYPFTVALGYVFIYPLLALGFYAVTLWYKKLSKDVKTKIEKITPIHPDEAKKIREDIVRLEDEKDEALKKLGKKEDEYKEKLQPLEQQISDLQNDKIALMAQVDQLAKEKEELNRIHNDEMIAYQAKLIEFEQKLKEVNASMQEKNEKLDEFEQKVKDLLGHTEKTNATVQVNGVSTGQTPAAKQVSDDHSKVVKYLHDSYKNMMEEDLVAKLMSADIGVANAVARKIINQLIEEKVLLRSHSGVISITPEGSSKLVELMEGIHV